MTKFLIGVAGIAVILLIAVAFSANRRAIRPRVVCAAFALQASIAVLVLYVPWGRAVLAWMSGGVSDLLGYANAGTQFLFGRLATDPLGQMFAIQALPVIIFFAALVSILCGDKGVSQLLVLSQVVLSLQLPFAVIPLIRFTSDQETMGTLANPRWLTLVAYAVAALIVGHLNLLDVPRATVVGRVDVIFCRNVLIYFDAPSKQRIINRLLDRLDPQGYFFLGHSESLNAFDRVRAAGPTVYALADARTEGR